MSEAGKLVAELRSLENDYKPLGHAAEVISQVSLVEIIGSFCAGKTTTITKVTELDPDFSNPFGFTTREARPGDPKDYRIIPHDSKNLSEILEKARNGDLVQYAVHPTLGKIYGTEPQDYNTPYAILDTLYSVVRSLSRVGFKNTVPISLVTSPESYMAQIAQRYPNVNSLSFKKRVEEGVLSLEWSLENSDDVFWVENHFGKPEKTALDVIAISKDKNPITYKLDSLARGMLKTLDKLR